MKPFSSMLFEWIGEERVWRGVYFLGGTAFGAVCGALIVNC